MKKQELNMILKLIDLHTSMHDGGYYGKDYPEITESGIKALKKDIRELFDKGENSND